MRYGFLPGRVDVIRGGYRLFFRSVKLESTGILSAGDQVVATRTLGAEANVLERSCRF